MRILFLVALLIAPGIATHAADVELLRVWPSWREAESFDRVREYFGGSESSTHRVVARTQADSRGGYYFLVRVRSAAAQSAAKFELAVIRPDSPQPKTFAFVVSIPAKETVYQLGLTGSDWPAGDKANPVAWKLALVGPDGRVLAEQKSFLWEKPAK